MSSLTPLRCMELLGFEPDPWQKLVLESPEKRILLNCCRQAGKSTVVAILALVEALTNPMHKVLILSRSQRQSKELFRQCVFFHEILKGRLKHRTSAQEMQLKNFSRIVSLPCKEETIRGFAHVNLLIIDEAARVPDDLYRAVRPMLAVSGGRMICLSTPYGKRGFFYEAWADGEEEWLRVRVPASDVPRISPAFLEQERRALGESWYRQEYFCAFEALEGLVYPRMAECVLGQAAWPAWVASVGQAAGPAAKGFGLESKEAGQAACPTRWVGGIDFGFRNPFAAVWGVLDKDGVLWLVGEHYQRQKPLSHHIRRLPRNVEWYADPAGASEIAELRHAGFVVRKGANALRPGIAAVTARIENGGLKILAGRCPQLLAEAELYRYSDAPADKKAEVPVDENNHALAALRYLVSRLDARRSAAVAPAIQPPTQPEPSWAEERYRRILDDDRYWLSL